MPSQNHSHYLVVPQIVDRHKDGLSDGGFGDERVLRVGRARVLERLLAC